MADRNLDGIYFRVERDGSWDSVCFSDLTKDQMLEILQSKEKRFLISLCVGLGERLRELGDALELVF